MTIYLDNNATTRPSDAVRAAMDRAEREHWHNPSSIHRPGQAARQTIELARKSLAALVGVRPRQLTLAGSGTEAIDLAVRGTLDRSRGRNRTGDDAPVLMTSRVEHSAVRSLAEAMEERGEARVRWLDLDEHGVVTAAAVRAAIESGPKPALVSVQWANNETGAIHPIADIAAACRETGVLMHCDATQLVGKQPLPIRIADALPDLLTFSPHKFHGPKGVGVLYVRAGVSLVPQVVGVQELGRRGGTENTSAIVGAGIAADEAASWLVDAGAREGLGALRDRFESLVLQDVPDAVINGPRDQPGEAVGTRRLWNTTNIGFPKLEAEALLLLLSERGVCASAGAACSSGSLDPSPVLLAMGIERDIAHGSLRFSLSRETTEQEIDRSAIIVAESICRLAASMPRPNTNITQRP